MKVLHVLNELKFSGAEIMYVAAAKEFRALGCELYVVNTTPNLGEYAPFFEQTGYKVLHWPYRSISDRKNYIRRTILFLKENKIDVVHIHASGMRLLMSYCAWQAGCKSVYTFHSVFKSSWYSYMYHVVQRMIIKHIFRTKFQTISDSVYNHEKKYYFNNTHLVYNWFNTSSFFPATTEDKISARHKLGISYDKLVLISIGGCSHIKRHEDIIQALSLLSKSHPDCLYLHLGEGCTTVDEINLAKSLKIENKIRFVGNKRNVRDYLIASDLYLMTSRFEGISLTTIEALACKIPTILYEVPGLRDFNNEKECAVLVQEEPKLLAEAITRLYTDEIKKKNLLENGHDYITRKFDMKKNVQQIHNLYKA